MATQLASTLLRQQFKEQYWIRMCIQVYSLELDLS